MERPRPFRRERYDKDRFTDRRISNRDAWRESSRKRKSSYDLQRPMPAATRDYNFPRRAGPKSCSDDLRDKEFQSSSPASPRRGSSHFRDYPRKTHSWDQKGYAESSYSDKRDHYNTRSEHAEYSSFRGHSQSPYHKDFLPLSGGRTHKTSKWSACMTEGFNQIEHHQANEQKAQDNNVSHFQELHNCGLEKLDQMEVFATSSLDLSSTNIVRSQNVHQVHETGGFLLNIHESDHQTYRASRWSPLRTEAVSCLGSHESNAHEAREDNTSDFQEFRNPGPQKPEQVNVMETSSCDIGFKSPRESQSLQQSFLKAQTPGVRCDEKGWQTHKAAELSPRKFEHLNQQSNGEQRGSDFQEFQNFGQKNLVQMTLASSSREHASINIRASQTKQNPGAFAGDFDAKCSNEKIHKSESSSIVKTTGEASTTSEFDNGKMLGDYVGSSECDLRHETNRLLQNALRLLNAASGIVSADASSGETQGQDNVKIMKLLLDSGIQNLKHSLVETTGSKNIEAITNFDNFGPNGEKDSIRLDDQCKYEKNSSAIPEKLWDGTLQLSTTVTVSAVAFFKSGEKMQDFHWSGSAEVKGKVRLEAFEKYVQDLPRSRSRGLMVVSFCCKEGFSDADFKGMNEVAEKYKERKKVGFAQLSNGVDLYICPHSEAVITILAKYGFFKGMAAVMEKSDPLIGCVVWRKTPSSVPALKATEVSAPQSSSETSLRSPFSFSDQPAQSGSSTMAHKNQDSMSSLLSVGGGKSKGDNHPGFETNTNLDKSNSQPPTVIAQNSSASSDDDDDLPEYDFGTVVSGALGNHNSEIEAVNSSFQAEKFMRNNAPRPLSTLMGPESSTPSRTSPDFHFQGVSSQSMEHQSSHSPSLPIEPQKQIAECKESSKAPDNHFQGPVLEKLVHVLESENSSLSLKQQKPTEKSTASKSCTLFENNDDDDIPEWCPPGFTEPGLQVTQGAGPCFIPNHSKAHTSGFVDSHSRPLPPLPPAPPPAQLQIQSNEYHSAPCFRPLPPLPPTPPPTQLQLQNNGYHSAPRFGPLPPLPPTPLPAQLQPQSNKCHSAPHFPSPIIHRSSAGGFVQNSLNFAQSPTSRPQFDPVGVGKPVYPSAWSSSRP